MGTGWPTGFASRLWLRTRGCSQRPCIVPTAATPPRRITGGNQLEFFTLRGSDLKEGGSDLSSCLLRAIVSMMNTTPDDEMLPEGAKGKDSSGSSQPPKPSTDEADAPQVSLAVVCKKEHDLAVADRALRKTLNLTVTWDAPSLAKTILTTINAATQEENAHPRAESQSAVLVPLRPVPPGLPG